MTWYLEHGGKKGMIFSPPTRFLQNMLIEVSHGHVFYRHKEQGQADLPDTLNIVVKQTENFLEAFEKKF